LDDNDDGGAAHGERRSRPDRPAREVAPARRAGPAGRGPEEGLLADAQALDRGAVARHVLALEVVEQPAAAPDELEEPTPAVVVLVVGLEVVGELVDAGGQQGDLDLRRPGVV